MAVAGARHIKLSILLILHHIKSQYFALSKPEDSAASSSSTSQASRELESLQTGLELDGCSPRDKTVRSYQRSRI
jgi:hypothetical protein